MTISRPYQMAVAAAEVAQGLACLLTLTLWRPDWTVRLRLAGLIAAAERAEALMKEQA